MPGVVSRGRGRRAMNEINMVPFIDVMLVLLIIFMVTAPLITTGVVDLPSVGQARQAESRVVEIEIGRDEKMKLGVTGEASAERETVTIATLASRVRDKQGGKDDTPVVISADKNVKYEAVVSVMDTLQKAGVKRVGLSVAQGR